MTRRHNNPNLAIIALHFFLFILFLSIIIAFIGIIIICIAEITNRFSVIVINEPGEHECEKHDVENNLSSYVTREEYTNIEDCSICILSMEIKDIERLRCGHMFHRNCLSTWMEINNICPSCRSKGCCVRIV